MDHVYETHQQVKFQQQAPLQATSHPQQVQQPRQAVSIRQSPVQFCQELPFRSSLQNHVMVQRHTHNQDDQGLEPHQAHTAELQSVQQPQQAPNISYMNTQVAKPSTLHRPAHPPPLPPISLTSQRYTPVDEVLNNTVVPIHSGHVPVPEATNQVISATTTRFYNLPQRDNRNHNYYVNTHFQIYRPSNLQTHCQTINQESEHHNHHYNNGQPRQLASPLDVDDRIRTQNAMVSDSSDTLSQDTYTEVVIQAILAAKEALEKPIEERDERDIQLIDNLCSLVHGFDSFPRSIRRALAAQSVLIVIDERGKELIVHNEELDSFCVLIFGECEQLNVSKTVPIRYYHVGDSFGVCEPTTETIRFVGHMVTKCENCAFLCVKRDDFFTILTDPANYPDEEIIRHRDKTGNVICVSQFNLDKKSSAPIWSHHMQSNNPLKLVLPDGHIIIKATEECLLLALVDGYDRTDTEYVDDFLLLFRVFMTPDLRDKEKNLPPGMIKLCSTLIRWLDQSNYRDKVVKIVLTWLSSYYHDFELNPDFSYQFFRLLESKLLSLSMHNQLHLLHVTLSTKSKIRHVTISRSSREHPLNFRISGGYEKNCGIFVTQVYGLSNEENSCDILLGNFRQSSLDSLKMGPTVPPRHRTGQNLPHQDSRISAQLRPGDQILEVNGTNFAAIQLVEAQRKLDMSTHLSLTVKFNPSAFNEMRAVPEGRRKSSISSISSVSPFIQSNHTSKFTFNPMDQIISKANNDSYPPSSPLISANSNFGFRSMMKSGPKNDKSRLTSLINSSKLLVKQLRESTGQIGSNSIETMSKTSGDNISDDQSNDLDLNRTKSNPDLPTSKSKERPIESNLSSIVRLNDLGPNLTCETTSGEQTPVNVIKVYNAANNEFRYLLVHDDTTAREVVMVAVKEFNLTIGNGSATTSSDKTTSSLNWHLYEVSVVPESRTIKQKCLSEQTSHLATTASLSSRFYIKCNSQMSLGPSKLDMGDDALVNEILKESPSSITLTSLDPILLAVELTQIDFDKFRAIEPQQFVYDTFFDHTEKKQQKATNGSDNGSLKSSSSDGQDVDNLSAMNKSRCIPKNWMKEYSEFADISNREMFWVVCEILNEKNISERVKIIKLFIRVAYVCEHLRNYNSMFAIISGLGHSCVNRLKRTFDKLKSEYKKELDTMRNLFDPSRNMSNYRNCLHQIQPPAIPLFPQIKKDLTFTKEGRSIFIRESNELSDEEDNGNLQNTLKRNPRADLLTVKSATLADNGDQFLLTPQTTRSFTFTPFNNSRAVNSDADSSILVNFAEIRQFTDRVRNVIYYSSIAYTKDLLTNSKDGQRNQAQVKKMHEEWQMRKRIRHYISKTFDGAIQSGSDLAACDGQDQVDAGTKQNGKSNVSITYDERTLYQRSLDIEPELNSRPPTSSQTNCEKHAIPPTLQTILPSQVQIPLTQLNMLPPPAANSSPTLSKSSSLSSCSSFSHHMPNYHVPRGNLSSSVGKFGTESTESLRKLRSLSENVEDWKSFNNDLTTGQNRGDNIRSKNPPSRMFPPKTTR